MDFLFCYENIEDGVRSENLNSGVLQFSLGLPPKFQSTPRVLFLDWFVIERQQREVDCLGLSRLIVSPRKEIIPPRLLDDSRRSGYHPTLSIVVPGFQSLSGQTLYYSNRNPATSKPGLWGASRVG